MYQSDYLIPSKERITYLNSNSRGDFEWDKTIIFVQKCTTMVSELDFPGQNGNLFCIWFGFTDDY